MINAKSLTNKELFRLMQEYRKKFKEKAFLVEMPSGTTNFPNETTETDIIEALKRCLNEDIKLYEIYPSLIVENDEKFDANKKI